MVDWSASSVVVTGGAGFLGRVVVDKLRARGCSRVAVPRRSEYDLTNATDVERMYDDFVPDMVIHLAAEVGGIGANREHPGRFFYANMAMGLHLIEQARVRQLDKFVQAGTVCAYPKYASVPFQESELWNGYPEETNAPYGIAKKALMVMLDAYQREYDLKSAYVLPVNLYGPGDNFDPHTSHVIPALIRKCVSAAESGLPEIVCWGTGSASREFLYVDDAAEGIVCCAERVDVPRPINLGSGHEIGIRRLTQVIASLTGFSGAIRWDESKPDGQPRRCLDTETAKELLDWRATTKLESGIERTIAWYRSQHTARAA